MGFSKQQDASPDCRAFLDAVVASVNGAKMTFGKVGNSERTCPHCKANNINRNSAWNFRQRCFNAKIKQRALSRTIYAPGEPMHDKSPWDNTTIYLMDEPDGRCSVVGVHNLEGMSTIAEFSYLEPDLLTPEEKHP